MIIDKLVASKLAMLSFSATQVASVEASPSAKSRSAETASSMTLIAEAKPVAMTKVLRRRGATSHEAKISLQLLRARKA